MSNRRGQCKARVQRIMEQLIQLAQRLDSLDEEFSEGGYTEQAERTAVIEQSLLLVADMVQALNDSI